MNQIASLLALGVALAVLPPSSLSAGPQSAAVLDLAVAGGQLKVAFCAEDVVRVAYARDASFFGRASLAAGAASLRARSCPAYRLRGTGDSRHAEDEGPGGPRDRRDRVPRRAGRSGARRAGRRSVSRARGRAGRADVPRAAAVDRKRRRVALRSRTATAGPSRPQGLRPRPLAAQRDRDRALPRLQPRLRHPLGQPVLHALRRPAALGAHPARPPARRDGPARRPHRLLLRGGGFRDARGDARRPGDRDRRARRREAAEPAHPPLAAAGGGDRRSLGGRRRGDRDRRPPLPAPLERRHPHVGGRPPGGRPLAPGLAPLDRPRPRAAREGPAHGQGRVVQGPGDGDGAAPVEAAGEGALDVAVVRGGGRRRLLLRLRAGPRPRGRRLPEADRRGADDAALGLRPLAEPAALRDAATEPRRGGRLPLAPHPVRQHRAGLVLLAGERLGLAPLRSRRASPTPTAGSRRSTTGTRGS